VAGFVFFLLARRHNKLKLYFGSDKYLAAHFCAHNFGRRIFVTHSFRGRNQLTEKEVRIAKSTIVSFQLVTLLFLQKCVILCVCSNFQNYLKFGKNLRLVFVKYRILSSFTFNLDQNMIFKNFTNLINFSFKLFVIIKL